MSQPESTESQPFAGRVVEVPIRSRSRREALPVHVVIRAESDAAGAPAPGDATLAA